MQDHYATILANRKAMLGEDSKQSTIPATTAAQLGSPSLQWALNIVRGSPLHGRQAAQSGQLAAVWAIIGDYTHSIGFPSTPGARVGDI